MQHLSLYSRAKNAPLGSHQSQKVQQQSKSIGERLMAERDYF